MEPPFKLLLQKIKLNYFDPPPLLVPNIQVLDRSYSIDIFRLQIQVHAENLAEKMKKLNF